MIFQKFSQFALTIVLLGALGAGPLLAAPQTSTCEKALREGEQNVRMPTYLPGQRQHPAAEHFERAIEACSLEGQRITDPEKRAQLAANEALARARYVTFYRGEKKTSAKERRQRAYEALETGIATVSGLTSDLDPALLPLLHEMTDLELNLHEDGEAAHRLLRQSLRIRREAYGEEDGRYAEGLMHLAYYFTPSDVRFGESPSWADAETADRFYQEALRIRLANPEGPGLDLQELAVLMKANYEEMGETDRAAELEKAIEAALVENAILDEIEAEEATLEVHEKQEENTGTPAEGDPEGIRAQS